MAGKRRGEELLTRRVIEDAVTGSLSSLGGADEQDLRQFLELGNESHSDDNSMDLLELFENKGFSFV